MSRTKGALNKPKKAKNGLFNIELEKHIENNPIIKDKGHKWVTIGHMNTYYFDLLDLYNTSVTMKACVNFAVRAIVGQGLDTDRMKIANGDLTNPNYFTDWNTFINNFVLDYIIYGGAAFEIIKNKDGKTYSFFNVPFDTLKPSPMDEDGVIKSYWQSADWSAWTMNPPIEIPTFSFQEDETISSGKPYIFVLKSYNPTNVYFPAPRYLSALNQIQTEAQMQLYDLKMAVNQFVPQGMLTVNQMETEEEKQAFLDNLQANYQGAQNAGNLMVTFKNQNDENPVTFTPFTVSTENVNLYDTANERVTNRICESFGIPSKMLIGLPVDNQGFSNQGTVMQTAFNLYNVNIATNDRSIITGAINNALAMNGIDTEIKFKPINYILSQDDVAEAEDGNAEVTDDSLTSEDDATEQVISTENNA